MNESNETVAQQPVYTSPQVPKKRGNNLFWVVLLVSIAFCALCGILPFALVSLSGQKTGTETNKNGVTYSYILGNESSENKLLAVYIDQPILTSAQDYDNSVLTSLLVGQYVFGYQIKDQLTRAANDSSVKGVVLIINSPGGTVVGARAIADGVAFYRSKTNNPVYAYVQDMAASGAYWAAASTDKIYAEQGSLTGSIGVIMGPFEYYDKLVQLGTVGTVNGISLTYITGGKYKDFGNPTRKLTDEELSIMQTGINDEYDKFVSYVSLQRGITKNTIKEDIKALIYGATAAKEYKLIDEVGTREQVLADLAEKAGVSDYKLVKVGQNVSFFGTLFSKLVNTPTPQAATGVARSCLLCGRELYFYGNPLEY